MKPILTAHLLPAIERHLIALLRSLTPAEWELQTVAPAWNVKAVAAHMLDTQLRKLSRIRDGYAYRAAPGIGSYGDLVAYVNHLNHEGVEMYRRLSPAVLISLMDVASRESAEFHQSLDPFAPAGFGVSWAGEETSLNWFDTARELTERWHHQQQIRLATGKPGIMTPDLYHPVLDCFMRALPFAYRRCTGTPGTHVRITVSGECGGSWFLHREDDRWELADRSRGRELASATIPQEIAWRVFTKGIGRTAAEAQVSVSGDRDLALHVLGMTTIIG